MKTHIAVAALLLALAGCAATPSDAPRPEEQAIAETVDSACDAVTADEVSAALGFDAPEGRSVSANVTQNDLTWTADRCRWQTDAMDVKVSISTTDDFASGAVSCPVVSANGQDGTEVAGLADSASFAFDDFAGSTAELRACTSTVLVDVSVETEAQLDAASAQDSLESLALLVLERL